MPVQASTFGKPTKVTKAVFVVEGHAGCTDILIINDAT
jgi:hypothetical protein